MRDHVHALIYMYLKSQITHYSQINPTSNHFLIKMISSSSERIVKDGYIEGRDELKGQFHHE